MHEMFEWKFVPCTYNKKNLLCKVITKYNSYVHHAYIWQNASRHERKTCGRHITTQAHMCILHLVIQ